MDLFPPEILEHILSYLPYQDWKSAQLVCRKWRTWSPSPLKLIKDLENKYPHISQQLSKFKKRSMCGSLWYRDMAQQPKYFTATDTVYLVEYSTKRFKRCGFALPIIESNGVIKYRAIENDTHNNVSLSKKRCWATVGRDFHQRMVCDFKQYNITMCDLIWWPTNVTIIALRISQLEKLEM